MRVIDKQAPILYHGAQLARQLQNKFLEPLEIRLISEGKLGQLADFAASSRLNTPDPKGDTPLHLAARIGNLAVCDLFVRSGAFPETLNHDGQTPADVALLEGHALVAQLLSSLVSKSPKLFDEKEELPQIETTQDASDAERKELEPVVQEQDHGADDLVELLSFDAEDEPSQFFRASTSEPVTGTFVALVSTLSAVSNNNDGDWNLDLSPAHIAGDGINASAVVVNDQGTENDFLKVRNRGRQSVKRFAVQSGTRLSIDQQFCWMWAEEILSKGWCSFDDINDLIANCEGNGDIEDLRANLHLVLEDACLEPTDQENVTDLRLWDNKSDVSLNELVEAIEAALTRKTRLPGSKRFTMDIFDELQLLEGLTRAKQELLLGTLASETAVEFVLENARNVLDGLRNFKEVTGNDISRSLPYNHDTADFYAAFIALKHWAETGGEAHGKQRRDALTALDTLNLSIPFHKELIRKLLCDPHQNEHAIRMSDQIAIFEAATERLIREHLPYARRVASRNAVGTEDLDDVFQVAFIGLQRAPRRFDPTRGFRFLIFASFWMQQAIQRWRIDESATIRIPVGRNNKIAELDLALDRLDLTGDCRVSDDALASELGWTIDEVRKRRRIPRVAVHPEKSEDWDNLMPEQDDINVFDKVETQRIVREALAELPEREAEVIRMRYGIGRDTDMTLEEIGRLYGVTRERIRQIEAKCFDRLSHPYRKRRLQELMGLK